MRRLFLLLCALGFAFAARNPQLDSMHAVYLLPMSGSLDQYLATHLAENGVLQVVTDPQKADAVFTDKIGESFEQRMNELYPPPETKKSDEDETTDALDKPIQRVGGSTRGRGSLFLVDRNSRNVVWSMYSPVRSSRPDDMNSRARQIVEKLTKAIRGK